MVGLRMGRKQGKNKSACVTCTDLAKKDREQDADQCDDTKEKRHGGTEHERDQLH
jgi:hypothetical protein